MILEGFPEKVTLKDGTQTLIRPMVPDDFEAVVEFFRAMPAEDRLFLRDDVTKPEVVHRLARGMAEDTAYTLLAYHEGVIIGNATIYRSLFGWMVHVANIRVAVAHDFQRKGLATHLIMLCVRLATNLGLDKIVAEVADKQANALHLFEKLGFRREAVLKGHIRDMHGMRRDLVLLTNDVAHIWETMEAMMADYSPTGG